MGLFDKIKNVDPLFVPKDRSKNMGGLAKACSAPGPSYLRRSVGAQGRPARRRIFKHYEGLLPSDGLNVHIGRRNFMDEASPV